MRIREVTGGIAAKVGGSGPGGDLRKLYLLAKPCPCRARCCQAESRKSFVFSISFLRSKSIFTSSLWARFAADNIFMAATSIVAESVVAPELASARVRIQG